MAGQQPEKLFENAERQPLPSTILLRDVIRYDLIYIADDRSTVSARQSAGKQRCRAELGLHEGWAIAVTSFQKAGQRLAPAVTALLGDHVTSVLAVVVNGLTERAPDVL